MTTTLLGCVFSLVTPALLFAVDDRSGIETLAPVSVTVLSTALERVDIAITRSVIAPNQLKGGFAENLSNRLILNKNADPEKWQAISPRLGPQGLDHVAVRLDRDGRPLGLLVAETKFNTSQLGRTKSGIQMGRPYTAARLAALAVGLRDIHAKLDGGITTQRKPPSLNQRYEIRIPIDGRTSVSFWRHRALDQEWRYGGPQELLPKARAQLLLLSGYLSAAADDKITFTRRIFVWKLSGDHLLLNVRDATALKEGMSIGSLPSRELPPILLSETRWVQNAFRKSYGSEIVRKLPGISQAEARTLADEVYNNYASVKGSDGLFARRSFSTFAAEESLEAGAYGAAITAPIELAFQIFGHGPIEWERVASISALSGGSATAGTFSWNFVAYGLIRSQFGMSMAERAAEIVGLRSAGQVANLSGTLVGGGVASVVFAYGGYYLGYYDLSAANRSAIAAVAGATGGTLASVATLGLVGAYGTAGTSVAISTLGGAAATNASLAVLGGGTIAGGGFGMAGGTLLLGTGVGIAAVVVAGGVMYGFHLYDEAEDNKRIGLTLSDLSFSYSQH